MEVSQVLAWRVPGAIEVNGMDKFFLQSGIRAIDFITISTGFLLTMLCFFAARDKKYLNRMLLLVFVLQCMFSILFHEGLAVKLFAALMLVSTLIVEVVVSKKRSLNAS